MRKLLIIFCIPLLCLCCSDSESERPIMEIVGIYIDGDEEEINYVDQFSKIPDLGVGDVIDFSFILDGNGNNLRSFILGYEKSDFETLMDLTDGEISPDFSDLNGGKAVFVDGIIETEVTVKVKIKAPLTTKPLSFHLNPKSPDSKSAIIGLDLKSKHIFYPEKLESESERSLVLP